MWKKIEQYCSRGGENSSGNVTITYDPYGFYVCTIKRAYFRKLQVQATGKTAEAAFEAAKERVKRVEALEKDLGKLLYVDADTPGINQYDNGYALLPVTDDPKEIRHVHYKTIGSSYVIVGLQLRDENGYQVFEEPKEPNEEFFKADSEHPVLGRYMEKEKQHLKEGEELYMFDTIQMLSGSAGFAVMKDNKVLRMRTDIVS